MYRSMLDHHIWTQHPPEYLKIWLYFLMRAARKPRPWWDGEREITIPMGGFVGSLKTISDNCRVGRKQAERAVELLKKCDMIEAKPGNRYSVYVVVNFAAYQSPEAATGKPEGSQRDASGTPAGNQREAGGKPEGQNNREYVIGDRKHAVCEPTAAAHSGPSLAPLSAAEWAEPDAGQEARLLVGELLKTHPNPGNLERAVWSVQRVLAESLEIPRIMASIRTSHEAWCVLWKAEPKRFRPLLHKWVDDGDYMTTPAPPANKELEW